MAYFVMQMAKISPISATKIDLPLRVLDIVSVTHRFAQVKASASSLLSAF
jgi:hypothetical protein